MTTVYFATNRKPNRQRNPDGFTEEIVGDVQSLRFGRAKVPGDDLFKKDVTTLEGGIEVEVAPETLNAEDATRSKLGSVELFREMRRDLQDRPRDILVYIHGYNYTFLAAVARTAQLSQWLSAHPHLVFLFSWPSLGAGVTPGNYRDERRIAEASGSAIGRGILKAADYIRQTQREPGCTARVHLMAHSMGGWALRGAVQMMRTFSGDNIAPIFDQVLLMATDEDNDTLGERRKLAPILNGCHRLTAYYNQQDAALKASDWAMGNPDRLGLQGPRFSGERPTKVVSVNCSPAIVREPPQGEDWLADPSGHQYYRNNELVRKDVLQVLKGVSDEDIAQRAFRDTYYRLG